MDKNEVTKKVINNICSFEVDRVRIMEVCGTHTQAIAQTGIRSMLPSGITLTSGPGCPVCVTHESYIDIAIKIIKKYDVILVTFGDMVRVKGTSESLLDQSAKRENIKVVYSPLEVIELAKQRPEREVVFFAVGFETTAPLIALTVKKVYEQGLSNIYFLNSLKLMPPILQKILQNDDRRINGIICPGHVAAVKGAEYFRFITKDYDIPAVVCGFDALDIAAGLYYLIKQHKNNCKKEFKNLYKTCVNKEGSISANQLMQEVFKVGDARWRGIGQVNNSELKLSDAYRRFDAINKYNIKLDKYNGLAKKECNCSEVLLGNILPSQCKLFGRVCNPMSPKGPCMVSGEGACSIYYRYRGRIGL